MDTAIYLIAAWYALSFIAVRFFRINVGGL